MSIITTGINIVATGVSRSINQVQRFGQAINQTHRQAQTFANGYNQSTRQVQRHSSSLTRALNQNWRSQYRAIRGSVADQRRQLQILENAYDRTFREIGNKYQSMVMGSVALSMSGVGIMNAGRAVTGVTKVALDKARDFETVMEQIRFYGKKTKEEMQQIQKDIFKMGFDLPVTTTEIGKSVLQAQKTGYNYDESKIMAKEASKIQFMSLGKLDGDESLKYISQIRKLSGYAVEDTTKLTDKLTMTADVSAASIDSLWKTIQSSRSAFDNLGTDMDSMLAIAGVMSDRLQPKSAGQALSSFGRGINMAEKAMAEGRGTRGEYYSQLTGAMGKSFDGYDGDVLKYIEDVAVQSEKIWGNGVNRTNKLISIFGNSAIDLFHAYDNYAKSGGRTMADMRKEIQNADGHSKKFMDTLMNTSYGTEMKLQAVAEQFQILFGTAIRPGFNMLLDGITKVIGAINEFMVAHPKLAKVLGYGFGIGGLLLVATGASMLFVGGLLAIYASLNNIIIQLARNTRVLNLLSKGYSTAGQMIKAQMLGPLRLLGISLLKMTGITFFLYLAWKNDFLRMRSIFTEWKNGIGAGLEDSSRMFEHYAKGSSYNLNKAFSLNRQDDSIRAWVANGITKARMLWDGVKDIWSDGTISTEKHQMLSDAGLIGIVEKVYEIKTAVTDFWKGFKTGLGDGLELLKDILHPLLEVWDWVSEKVLKLLQHFGYFENVNKGVSKEWERWGQKLGVMVGMALAIRIGLWGWVKAIKLAISPFKIMFKTIKGISSLIKGLLRMDLGKIGSGLSRALLPRQVRQGLNTATYSAQRRFSGNARQGAHSRLPYVRQNIDPQTGRPRTRNANDGRTYGGSGSRAGSRINNAYMVPETTRQRRWYQRNRRGDTVVPGRATGRGGSLATSSPRIRSNTFMGRIGDAVLGRRYQAQQTTMSNGRTQNYVVDRRGRRLVTDAQGRQNGRSVRSGGLQGFMNYRVPAVPPRGQGPIARLRQRGQTNRRNMNMANFRDAGMSYTDSLGQRGHRRRSVQAFVRGSINRSRRSNIVAGGGTGGGTIRHNQDALRNVSPDSNRRMEENRRNNQRSTRSGGRRGGKLGRLLNVGKSVGNLFKGSAKGIGKVAGKLGKGLVKGLGTVVKKGIPLLFKGALRAIPILGWALLAWDAIKLIFTNWDAIKNGASVAWNWIKEKGTALMTATWDWIKNTSTTVWTWIKNKASDAWNWVKTKASEAWNWVKTTTTTVWNNIKTWVVQKMTEAWNFIKTTASNAWNWIKTTAVNLWNGIKTWMTQKMLEAWNWLKTTASNAWNWIKSTAVNTWNNIKSWVTQKMNEAWSFIKTSASSAWNWVKSTATTAWNNIKSYVTSKMSEAWNWVKSTASIAWSNIKSNIINKISEAWSNIKSSASSTWASIKSSVSGAVSNMFQPIKDAWNSAKSYVTNNPIVQKITKVTESISSSKYNPLNWGKKGNKGDPGHRTGLWKVPKDNYPAVLHNGEMVLTQKEAQILRSMVGSDNNSVAKVLLGNDKGSDSEIKQQPKSMKLARNTTKIVAQTQAPTNNGGEKVEINFTEGSVKIHVANSSPSEIKRGAKQMFEEFKRMVELDNMKHYRPARPR